MALYRIGEANIELQVLGEGLRGGFLPPPEHPWALASKALRNLRAFNKAGWTFRQGTVLDWAAVQKLNGGDPPERGLLALHPSGGLVILRDWLVLQFRPGISRESLAERLQPYLPRVRPLLELGENLFEVGLSYTDRKLEEHLHIELTSLHQDSDILFAEPSILYHIGAPEPPTLDGPYSKWHWERINLPAAWEAGEKKGQGQGKGTCVAVIDEGFYAKDPQIQPNIGWKLTLDPNGLVVSGNKVPDHPHGTMCAGLIGAIHDKSEVNGAAPACKLGLVALADFCVCTQVALGIALQICAGLSSLKKDVAQWEEADVISCSLGITGSNWELSPPLRMAIDRVINEGRGEKGTPIVWATFNYDGKIDPRAVEGYPSLIMVSQSNYDDRRQGSAWGDSLDLLAPGYLVPVIWYEDMDDRRIEFKEGSSLAAPCVAGVAALVLAVNSDLTGEQVAEVITHNCDHVGKDTKFPNPNVGWGRLNAQRAVTAALEMLEDSEAAKALAPPPVQPCPDSPPPTSPD